MKALNTYVLTFNCARNVIEPERFAPHIFDALSPPSSSGTPSRVTELPEILVLALQEVSPIAYAFLGGSYLDRYYDAFLKAVEISGARVVGNGNNNGACYRNLVTKNAGMTALMVFVRSDVLERIRYVETAEVGVGVQEAGNKGAVGARIGYLAGRDEEDGDGDGIVEVTFVSAHLAPHEGGCKQRNEDWKSIAQRLVFESDGAENARIRTHQQEDEEGVPLLRNSSSLGRPSALYSPTSYLFVAGDFNYRTSDTRPGPNDFERYPRPTDNPNNISHFAELLAQDQLTRERTAGRTFQNMLESKITFPPTYKYSLEARDAAAVDPNGFWHWAKHRWPSWCDRILYLNHPSVTNEAEGIKVHEYTILPLFSTSDHRAVALSASIPLQSLPEPSTYRAPFDVDLQWESKRAAARRKELAVGAAAYLGLTWEGNCLALATSLGIAATYYGLHSMLGS